MGDHQTGDSRCLATCYWPNDKRLLDAAERWLFHRERRRADLAVDLNQGVGSRFET
jgi:hypothetical protein